MTRQTPSISTTSNRNDTHTVVRLPINPLVTLLAPFWMALDTLCFTKPSQTDSDERALATTFAEVFEHLTSQLTQLKYPQVAQLAVQTACQQTLSDQLKKTKRDMTADPWVTTLTMATDHHSQTKQTNNTTPSPTATHVDPTATTTHLDSTTTVTHIDPTTASTPVGTTVTPTPESPTSTPTSPSKTDLQTALHALVSAYEKKPNAKLKYALHIILMHMALGMAVNRKLKTKIRALVSDSLTSLPSYTIPEVYAPTATGYTPEPVDTVTSPPDKPKRLVDYLLPPLWLTLILVMILSAAVIYPYHHQLKRTVQRTSELILAHTSATASPSTSPIKPE